MTHDEIEAQEATALADHEAELAVERWYEDRGWEEAMLQDEMEARAGVIPFDVAMAEAMAEVNQPYAVEAEYDSYLEAACQDWEAERMMEEAE